MPLQAWTTLLLLLLSGCNTPRITKPSLKAVTNRQGVTFTGNIAGVEDTWLHLESESGIRYTVSMENFFPLEQKEILASSKKLRNPPAWVSVTEGNQTYSNGDRLYSLVTQRPVSGRVIMRNTKDLKQAQLSFHNGYLHGLCTYWNQNEKREAEIEFNKGVKHGISVHWHPNSNIQSRAYYYEGQLHGTMEEFFLDGKRKSRSSWKNGIPFDMREEWHPSGLLARQYKYENGRLWSRLEWNEFGDLVRMERIPVHKP